jgi:hypothetical protein
MSVIDRFFMVNLKTRNDRIVKDIFTPGGDCAKDT